MSDQDAVAFWGMPMLRSMLLVGVDALAGCLHGYLQESLPCTHSSDD